MRGSDRAWSHWLRSTKLRRVLALSSVVLATGGLVLYRSSPSSAFSSSARSFFAHDGKNSVAFTAPGIRGAFSLSHTKVLSRSSTFVHAELKIAADDAERANERAPISIAVVLDTSGSMRGGKLDDAKKSVKRLLSAMRDDDEIAVVRYSDRSEVLAPLSRVGHIRHSLASRIDELDAGGGTNIPSGLSSGIRALEDASNGRVRRIVLVSDGLDSTRSMAESLARQSFESGVTVSSLGIGLDFDEGYMGAVAQSGHGNFAFINDGGSLSSFLQRELEQSATTTVENVRVDLQLPRGARFVSVTGADATVSGGDVELRLGSLFAGDERRVILEIEIDGGSVGASADIAGHVSFHRVVRGGEPMEVRIPRLAVSTTNDPAEVERGRDGAVLASAMSAIASKRQLEASSAYARGDIARATALAAENEAALDQAISAAPPSVAAKIRAQRSAYAEQKRDFGSVSPSSAKGKTVTKAAAAKDLDNLNRASSF